MTLTAELSAAIRDSHLRIEQVPLAGAMANGTIDLDDYRRLLRQLQHLHQTLESLLAEEPSLTPLYVPSMARAGDLTADLSFLGSGDDKLLPQTLDFADKIDREWRNNPSALVGGLYVFEGSRMGSMFLSRSLSKALGVPLRMGCGLDYHLRDAERRPMLFKSFKATLDAMPFLDADEVRRAAVETMESLIGIYTGVADPTEASLTGTIA